MRTGSPSPKARSEEADPHRTAMLNLVKKHLKIDLLDRLAQLVPLAPCRKWTWMAIVRSNG